MVIELTVCAVCWRMLLTLVPKRALDEQQTKQMAADLCGDLRKAGLPLRHAGSFGFDFGAVEWFRDTARNRNVVRRKLVFRHHQRPWQPGNLYSDVVRELLEVVRTGHEVRLAVNLNQHADAATGVDVALHKSLAGLAVGTLGRGSDTLLAEVSYRLLDVAVAGFERALAVHHARAGHLAQLSNLVWCYWHLSPL